jgi:hypothetical protein
MDKRVRTKVAGAFDSAAVEQRPLQKRGASENPIAKSRGKFLAVVVMLCFWLFATLSAIAQTSGTTGSLTWSINTGGTLTISGSGAMPDFESVLGTNSSNAPWYNYRSSITGVTIK